MQKIKNAFSITSFSSIPFYKGNILKSNNLEERTVSRKAFIFDFLIRERTKDSILYSLPASNIAGLAAAIIIFLFLSRPFLSFGPIALGPSNVSLGVPIFIGIGVFLISLFWMTIRRKHSRIAKIAKTYDEANGIYKFDEIAGSFAYAVFPVLAEYIMLDGTQWSDEKMNSIRVYMLKRGYDDNFVDFFVRYLHSMDNNELQMHVEDIKCRLKKKGRIYFITKPDIINSANKYIDTYYRYMIISCGKKETLNQQLFRERWQKTNVRNTKKKTNVEADLTTKA